MGWRGQISFPVFSISNQMALWGALHARGKVPGLGICMELAIWGQSEVCLEGEWCVSVLSAQLSDSVLGNQTWV